MFKKRRGLKKRNTSYENWLRLYNPIPNSEDLNKMEKMFTSQLSQNNPNYQPLKGA